MKRRSFLQAIGGAIAAVFAPIVAAKTSDGARLWSGDGPGIVKWAETNSDDWSIAIPEEPGDLTEDALEDIIIEINEFQAETGKLSNTTANLIKPFLMR